MSHEIYSFNLYLIYSSLLENEFGLFQIWGLRMFGKYSRVPKLGPSLPLISKIY